MSEKPFQPGNIVQYDEQFQKLYGAGTYRVIDCVNAFNKMAQPGDYVSNLVALGADSYLEYDVPCWLLKRG